MTVVYWAVIRQIRLFRARLRVWHQHSVAGRRCGGGHYAYTACHARARAQLLIN